MEELRSKEELEAELHALQGIQNAKGKEVADKKKANAAKEIVDPLLEELKGVKEKVKAVQEQLKKRFPTEQNAEASKKAHNEAKEKRAYRDPLTIQYKF